MSQPAEDGAVTEPERARAMGLVCRAGAIVLVMASGVALIGSWAMLGLGTIGEAKALGMLSLAAAGMAAGGFVLGTRPAGRDWLWLAAGGVCTASWFAAYASIA